MGVLNFSLAGLSSVKNFVLLNVLLLASSTYASPFPATASSALIAPEKGFFFLAKGFALKAPGDKWQLTEPLNSDEAAPTAKSASFRFKKVDSGTASLSIRLETLRADLTLENYAKRWMKDYSNYGFDLLATKEFTESQARGLVIDLFHKKTEQQVRQVLFMKDRKIVLFTCKDGRKNFTATVLGCNQVAKSFQWNDLPNRQKSF